MKDLEAMLSLLLLLLIVSVEAVVVFCYLLLSLVVFTVGDGRVGGRSVGQSIVTLSLIHI